MPSRSISASWTVPFVLPSARSSYSSAWIGIDGYNNSSLIQTGTEHEYVNGKANYYAWLEILPQAETRIKLPVYPGDLIEASIVKLSLSKWLSRRTEALPQKSGYNPKTATIYGPSRPFYTCLCKRLLQGKCIQFS
ncbi:G1 family glutamic endopeptidase [Paenibacillus sp. D51F]